MEYIIPLVLVLVLVGGFVTFLVLNATRRGSSATRGDEKQEAPPGIGQDDTPLGDTAEHAGHQTEGGVTTGGQDAVKSGGTGRPQAGYTGVGPGTGEDGAHVRRSGEGEGAEKLPFEDVRPPAAEHAAAQKEPGARAAGHGEEAGDAPEDREPERKAGGDEKPQPASERLADRGF